mmetsp:Transcript_17058/g.55565  ORF Transcript_17058/g.55565 Transcript_17058/m.55565 type:complete len:384 (+) Transcript_17058:855-2006(+)
MVLSSQAAQAAHAAVVRAPPAARRGGRQGAVGGQARDSDAHGQRRLRAPQEPRGGGREGASRGVCQRALHRRSRQDPADVQGDGAARDGRLPAAQVLHALRGPVRLQVPAQLGVDRLREQVQVPAALWLGCHLRAGRDAAQGVLRARTAARRALCAGGDCRRRARHGALPARARLLRPRGRLRGASSARGARRARDRRLQRRALHAVRRQAALQGEAAAGRRPDRLRGRPVAALCALAGLGAPLPQRGQRHVHTPDPRGRHARAAGLGGRIQRLQASLPRRARPQPPRAARRLQVREAVFNLRVVCSAGRVPGHPPARPRGVEHPLEEARRQLLRGACAAVVMRRGEGSVCAWRGRVGGGIGGRGGRTWIYLHFCSCVAAWNF